MVFYNKNMNLKKIIRSFALFAFVTFSAQPVSAQDLLARQAPVDRKMKAVDTLAFQEILDREYSGLPASDLYADWENRYAHRATELPDRYKIDLRDFCMPTTSRVVTSNFGARWGSQHKGLDIKVYIGDTIRAAFSGKVRIVRYEARGYGNYVVIRHDNGLETIYGHLSKHLCRENQEVRAGDVIGLGGNTGKSTGSHLHFETRLCGVALNPALMFDFRAQDVIGDYYTFNKSKYMAESNEATRLRGKVGNSNYSSEQVRGTSASNNNVRYETGKQFHKVEKGETLYSIARKRGISVDRLCELNHIGKTFHVRAGQILRYS